MGYGWALLKMVGALLLVCLLAYLALRLARRHLAGGAGFGGAVRVVERCPLSSRHSLWVVEVGGRCLLLGTSDAPGSGVCKLAELDPGQLPPRPVEPPRGRSFREILQRGRGALGGR